ncbi:hypothetical protein JYU34_008017 [Plutella xylostella]|uniref:Uncharacterized protein n=1 Tax=Plutella xylostella TaxID=51655 RepID=A0ABQ7QNM0_PLUXY|nr:hypothetical protein JYU34_008017 [Plutella xylostella]
MISGQSCNNVILFYEFEHLAGGGDLSDCVKVEEVSKCCGCQGQGQPVKVIFAPAMLPGMQSIFGPVPGIPYVVKPTQKINEQFKAQ